VDSYWLNDADGSFDSSPADKDVLTAEIGTLGVFYLKESRSEWDDGEYVGICVDAAGNNVGTTDSFWVIDDVIQGTGNFATHESVAAIQADSTSILTDTNEIQGKLPVAYIMGSAVTTSQDSKITDIKTKTDLYLDAAVSTRATAAVCTEGRLAELDATNLPADIDTLIARLTALRAGYLDNLSGGAVALASVCTDARLSELAAANLPADIDSLLARLTAGRATNLDNLDATISSVSTLITRALGIAGENQYVDNYVYTDGKLTSSRLRIYSLAASVGTAANVTATYTITATYGTSGVTTLSIVKV
jgi:hypothetical protein